jgi:hypothetical protein
MLARVASRELRHEPGTALDWSEQWVFEAASASIAWVCSLTLFPNRRAAWYWTMVRRDDAPLLHAADLTLRLPKLLEVRGDALWADHVCEAPFDHWTVANELMAVALASPSDALDGARGDLQPVALDMEWEASARPIDRHRDDYEVPAISHGELHLGSGTPGDVEVIVLDGHGSWRHRWGEWTPPSPVDDPAGFVVLDEAPGNGAVLSWRAGQPFGGGA